MEVPSPLSALTFKVWWWCQVGAKLTHSLDIINSFGELKVVVPLTAAQIPGTLETLKARKQHYLGRARQGESAIAAYPTVLTGMP